MAKTREQKKVIIKNLEDMMAKSKSVVFAQFDGLGVKENEELRSKLREQGSEYYVAKKTLMKQAFGDKIEGLNVEEFEGKVATIFGYEDEVSPARTVAEFKKTNENDEKITFLGGILENKFLTHAEIENLASLPSKLELYAKLVGSIKAPVSGFVNVLGGNLRKLVYVLKAIEEKK